MKFYQGRFKPKNPGKYKGDPTKIIYRSSWELSLMSYFDKNPDVIWWASEEVVIPYISPIDGKRHRYFPDFMMHTKKGKTVMIEVKPSAQTREPQKKSRVTKKYLNEVKTWGINQAKWRNAKAVCDKKGWEFQIITEEHLFGKRL